MVNGILLFLSNDCVCSMRVVTVVRFHRVKGVFNVGVLKSEEKHNHYFQ